MWPPVCSSLNEPVGSPGLPPPAAQTDCRAHCLPPQAAADCRPASGGRGARGAAWLAQAGRRCARLRAVLPRPAMLREPPPTPPHPLELAAGMHCAAGLQRLCGQRVAAATVRPRRARPAPRAAHASATAPGGWDKFSHDSWDTISQDELTDWQEQGPPTPLLDTVNFPVHIKNFNAPQLKQLCKELRAGAAPGQGCAGALEPGAGVPPGPGRAVRTGQVARGCTLEGRAAPRSRAHWLHTRARSAPPLQLLHLRSWSLPQRGQRHVLVHALRSLDDTHPPCCRRPDPHRGQDGRAPGVVPGCGGADRGAAPRVQHAGGQDHLGRGPPGVHPQDAHRPPQPHAHHPPAGRAVGCVRRPVQGREGGARCRVQCALVHPPGHAQ